MTDLIDRIGPYLGIAAFLGLALLAFLLIQQAREIRRLREWAGRAPERKEEAAEAVAAAAEARGEAAEVEQAEEVEAGAEPARGRVASGLASVRAWFADRFAAVDRRLPVDPRYLAALLAAAVIAAGVLTSGFGLFGGDEASGGGGGGGKKGGGGSSKPDKIEVAVLNATQEEAVGGGEVSGVPGLADTVAKQVVRPAGFAVGEKADATSGFEQTTVMFEEGENSEADELAQAVTDQLGEPDVTPMIDDVRQLAGGAPLALVVGRDDADFGG
jgi:hypothetical protein